MDPHQGDALMARKFAAQKKRSQSQQQPPKTPAIGPGITAQEVEDHLHKVFLAYCAVRKPHPSMTFAAMVHILVEAGVPVTPECVRAFEPPPGTLLLWQDFTSLLKGMTEALRQEIGSVIANIVLAYMEREGTETAALRSPPRAPPSRQVVTSPSTRSATARAPSVPDSSDAAWIPYEVGSILLPILHQRKSLGALCRGVPGLNVEHVSAVEKMLQLESVPVLSVTPELLWKAIGAVGGQHFPTSHPLVASQLFLTVLLGRHDSPPAPHRGVAH